jgi:hypothetical protein
MLLHSTRPEAQAGKEATMIHRKQTSLVMPQGLYGVKFGCA